MSRTDSRAGKINDKMRETSIFAHQKLKSYADTCMYAGGCNNTSVRTHAVQRKGPLSLLVENGHVAVPDQVAGKSVSEGPEMKVISAGWKNAATFRGLCGTHDTQVFGPVDSTINYTDPEQKFLLAYRACMKSVYEQRRGIVFQNSIAKKAQEIGLTTGFIDPFRVQEQHFRVRAKPAEEFKRDLDNYYLKSGYSRLEHEVFEIPDLGACVAASGMFYDRDDYMRKQAFMAVNLIPEIDRHVLLLSFYPEQRDAHRPYINLLNTKFGRNRRELVTRLILLRVRSFALRRSLWDSFSPSQQRKITEALQLPEVAGDLAGMSDSHLNFFETIV